jgi:hypothetical protein
MYHVLQLLGEDTKSANLSISGEGALTLSFEKN